MCLVTVGTANDMSVDPNAISAIRVPFDIDESPLSVGSIFHYDEVEIPPNRYALLAQTLPEAGEWEIDAEGVKERGTFDFVIDLRFVPDTTGRFDILRVGGAIGSANVLSTMTELA